MDLVSLRTTYTPERRLHLELPMTVDSFTSIGTESIGILESVGQDPDGQQDSSTLLFETLALLNILGSEVFRALEVLAEIREVGEETKNWLEWDEYSLTICRSPFRSGVQQLLCQCELVA